MSCCTEGSLEKPGTDSVVTGSQTYSVLQMCAYGAPSGTRGSPQQFSAAAECTKRMLFLPSRFRAGRLSPARAAGLRPRGTGAVWKLELRQPHS